MDDRVIKIRAGMIRKKLLTGVPADSSTHEIITRMSDEDLVAKADQEARLKVERLKNGRKPVATT